MCLYKVVSVLAKTVFSWTQNSKAASHPVGDATRLRGAAWCVVFDNTLQIVIKVTDQKAASTEHTFYYHKLNGVHDWLGVKLQFSIG